MKHLNQILDWAYNRGVMHRAELASRDKTLLEAKETAFRKGYEAAWTDLDNGLLAPRETSIISDEQVAEAAAFIRGEK
jgi:hypothetical protein